MSSSVVNETLHLSRVIRSASASQVATTVIVILAVQWVYSALYNLYFHPLSGIPGPKLAAISHLPRSIAQYKGRLHRYVRECHDRHGEVVRISPNEVSFIGPQAWKDIYGHATKANHNAMPHKHWLKYGDSINGSYSLITARDSEHPRMRRIFNPAFSDRSLKQQEPLFMKYVDLLVRKLKEGLEQDPERKFDMVRNYNFTTFDIMGDLTFGEPLHMLDNAEYDPWVSIIFVGIRISTRIAVLHNFPTLYAAFKAMIPRSLQKTRFGHFQYAVDRVSKRLDRGRDSEGVDLWDLVLRQEDSEGLTRGEMDANASLFMIAGTETTATLLAGLTYLLLQHPESMKKVVHEIRGSFKSSDDMHMEDLAALPYLNACIKEAFRIYPPVPVGMARQTPAAGSTICGYYVAGGYTVTLPQLAIYTSPRHFKDPFSYLPERWMGDERYADDNRALLQPFSFGTRDCVGKNMAYHEIRLVISKILYNFDLESCPENGDWIDQKVYTLWEKRPLLCKLRLAS